MPTCKERWKNIRTVFLRHLRKTTPSGSAGGIKKKYYLEDALQFLIPFLKSGRKQKGNLNLDCELNQGIIDSDGDDVGSQVRENQEIDSEVQVNKTQSQLNEAEPSETPKAARPIHKEVDLPLTAMKRKNKDIDAEKSLVEYFEAKKHRLDKPSETADEKFLLSLVPDMNLMNAHQKRKLKRGILDLIDKILPEVNSRNPGTSFDCPSVDSLSQSGTNSRPLSAFNYHSTSDTQSSIIPHAFNSNEPWFHNF